MVIPRTVDVTENVKEPESSGAAPGWASASLRLLSAYLGAAVSLGLSLTFIWSTRFKIAGETWFSLLDDAMISMTYARNLAHGNGLVWMAGGDRVEGFTNLLWTLWMAVLHLLPVPECKLSVLVMLTSAPLLAANAFVVYRLARAVWSDEDAAIAASVITALYFPLVYWALRGMEVGLLALLVGVLMLMAIELERVFSARRRFLFGVVMSVALMVRPDAALPCTVCAGYVTWRAPAGQRLRTFLLLAGVGIAVLGGLEAFRRSYYGEWEPNTYVLKMTGVATSIRVGRGLAVLGIAARSYLLPLLVGMAAAVWRRFDSKVLLLLATATSAIGYSVWVGGDAWEQMGYTNRFVCMAADAVLVLAALGATRIAKAVLNPALTSKSPLATGVLVAATIVAASCHEMYGRWMDLRHFDASLDAQAAAIGHILEEATPPSTTVAVAWAGAIPYFSHRPSLDLLGKTDRHVAQSAPHWPSTFWPGHNKWDYDYSIGVLRPDVVQALWNPRPADFERMTRLGYQGLPNGMWVRSDVASRMNLRALARQASEVLSLPR